MEITMKHLVTYIVFAASLSYPLAAFAESQIKFATCSIFLKSDGYKKSALGVNLTTTRSWYKSHGYSQTLKATLSQNVTGPMDAKFGKGNYRVDCAKAL